MKNRFIFTLVLCLASVTAFAGDFVSDFAGRANQYGLTFNYSGYVTDGQAPMELNGLAHLKGDTYLMEGNGLVVWCDGAERMTVDVISKEVVLESTVLEDATSFPMQLLSNLEQYFDWDSKGYPASFSSSLSNSVSSVKTLAFSLKPKKNASVLALVLYFDASGSIKGADITLKGNVRCVFGLDNVKFPDSQDGLLINKPTFDKSYIVTDLR